MEDGGMSKQTLTYLTHRRHRALRSVRGASAIKMLLLIPVAIFLFLAIAYAFFEGRKAYWDYRVREMCEKDGGVKVNKILEVDLQTYDSLKNQFGKIDIPRKEDARSIAAVVVHSYEDIYIRQGNPEVRRSRISVSRTNDGEVIATSTTYSRVGGDLVALHPSYFSCPETPNDFFASVILLKGNRK